MFAVASIVILSSCEKEDSLINDNNQQLEISNTGISMKDGRLIFKDSSTFTKHYRWVSANIDNPSIINRFNDSIGLISLNAIYTEGNVIEEHESFIKFYNVNKNVYNVVEFDSSLIYEMASPISCSYFINDDNNSSINKLINSSSIISSNEIEVKNILYNHKGLKWGQYSYRTAYRSSKYRLVARLKTISYGGEVSIEASSSTQRKRWGVWFGSNLSGNVGLSVSGKYYYHPWNYVWRWNYINSYESHNWQSFSKRVFSYVPTKFKINFGVGGIKVIHYGASKSITNSNIFSGSGL